MPEEKSGDPQFLCQVIKCMLWFCYWISENVWPADGATGKVRGSPKSAGVILWGSWMFVLNLMAIHQIVQCFWNKVVEQFPLQVCNTEHKLALLTSVAPLMAQVNVKAKRLFKIHEWWHLMTFGHTLHFFYQVSGIFIFSGTLSAPLPLYIILYRAW